MSIVASENCDAYWCSWAGTQGGLVKLQLENRVTLIKPAQVGTSDFVPGTKMAGKHKKALLNAANFTSNSWQIGTLLTGRSAGQKNLSSFKENLRFHIIYTFANILCMLNYGRDCVKKVLDVPQTDL